MANLGGEDDGHNDTVDSDDFAEDDGDKVLCSDSWGFDTSAEDGGACDEDTPEKAKWLDKVCDVD